VKVTIELDPDDEPEIYLKSHHKSAEIILEGVKRDES